MTYEELEKEWLAAQEMLALVLKAIGYPVVVSRKMMHEGLPNGSFISIENDIENDSFVFKLGNTDGSL